MRVGEEARRSDLIQQFVRDRGHFIGFLRVLSRDPELTEELFQELSVVVIERIDTFDARRDLGAWVRGIARNLYRKALERRRKAQASPSTYDPELVEAVLAAYGDRDARETEEKASDVQRLRRCLDRLPEHHRRMLADRYGAGLRIGRIAEIHRRTVSAVETALCRLRAVLLGCIRNQTEMQA